MDTGAWIALALTQDPDHEQARDLWRTLMGLGARLRISIPVVLETFTFLDRNTERDVALAWRVALEGLERFQILECTLADVGGSWAYFARR